VQDVAIARLEQLYPYPESELKALFASYPRLREVVWLQEEPQNMGYWEFLMPLLRETIDKKVALSYVGRPRSASPSEGSSAWHQINQKLLVEGAFSETIDGPPPQLDPTGAAGPGAPAKSPAPRETVKR
jgi:2-oxoglutarate dehydrogenase E1 component